MKANGRKTDRVKAVFIFHDADYYSGGTRSLLDLMDHLRERRDLEMTAVLPEAEKSGDTAAKYLRQQNIPVIRSEYWQCKVLLDEGPARYVWRFPERCRKLAATIRQTKKLAERLREEQIDVIYSNTGFVITGALLKKYLKTPYHIWHLREFGEEDHHYGILFGRRLYYRILNRYTDQVIVISKALYRKFEPHISGPGLTVIQDDVSAAYDGFGQGERETGGTLRILTAGLICPGKGQLQVIKAVKLLRDSKIPVHLTVAGGSVDRRYMESIRQYIRANSLEACVELPGIVKDMNALRERMHIGVVASESEAFGRVTIEGMLSGMVMIGADRGATAELIRDKVTGRLYEWNREEELAEQIRQLYEDPGQMQRLRRDGYQYALQFTKGHCAEAVGSLIAAHGRKMAGCTEQQVTI